jgi:hypothetical protein
MTIKQEYRKEIEGWNWAWIKNEAAQCTATSDSGEVFGSCFIGTVQSLAPSGRYTAPWNRTSAQDSAFFRALDDIAAEHGMWIESGEGDPCDLYACVAVETIEA